MFVNKSREGALMGKIIFKTIIGLIIGLVIYFSVYLDGGLSIGVLLLCIIWSIGTVYSIKLLVHSLLTILNSSMQLSIISALSFGSGIIGLILLIIGLGIIISFGWIYGLYILVKDLINVI